MLRSGTLELDLEARLWDEIAVSPDSGKKSKMIKCALESDCRT